MLRNYGPNRPGLPGSSQSAYLEHHGHPMDQCLGTFQKPQRYRPDVGHKFPQSNGGLHQRRPHCVQCRNPRKPQYLQKKTKKAEPLQYDLNAVTRGSPAVSHPKRDPQLSVTASRRFWLSLMSLLQARMEFFKYGKLAQMSTPSPCRMSRNNSHPPHCNPVLSSFKALHLARTISSPSHLQRLKTRAP